MHVARYLWVAVVATAICAAAVRPSAGAVIAVDTTEDGRIADGNCALREAIEAADTNLALDGCPAGSGSEADIITFQIPGTPPHAIQLTSALPVMTEPVVIDGTTQPGFAGTPVIEIDGSGAGEQVNGLVIVAGSSTVRGLAITGFRGYTIGNGYGLVLQIGGGNTVQGNHVGIDTSGTLSRPNQGGGIYVLSGNNLIGGTTAAQRNVVSGEKQLIGIYIAGTAATGNRVQGNYIGTDVSGGAALGNFVYGVQVGGPGNTVGGTAVGEGNLVSGNKGVGVLIACYWTDCDHANSSGNVVQGNLIGTETTGKSPLPNGTGVEVATPGNTIGGLSAGAGNIISGNANWGVNLELGNPGNVVQGNFIGTDITGTADLGNGRGILVRGNDNVVGGTTAGARNVISGNGSNGYTTETGVEILGSGNRVQGNLIGTDVTGLAVLPNAVGVMVIGEGNTVGGATLGAGNLISGNTSSGIWVLGSNAPQNVIQGNFIGVDQAGSTAMGNGTGIFLDNSPNSLIGGTAGGAGNVISGNIGYGVQILGFNTAGSVLQGNKIGTDAIGATAIPNTAGVYAVYGIQLGGTDPGAGNLISGNTYEGVFLGQGSPHQIQGNMIGVDAMGIRALPNGTGLWLETRLTTVGGRVPAARNVISGNLNCGIVLARTAGIGANGENSLEGNYIGTDVGGSFALPNGDGVCVNDIANTTIGGVANGAANLISGNLRTGILVGGPTAAGTAILNNKIGTDSTGIGSIPNLDGIAITEEASALVANNWIANNNASGLRIAASSRVEGGSSDNCFTYNSEFGASNLNPSATAPLSDNWWGAASGPAHASNPGGTGDAVTDHVDFARFYTSAARGCAPAAGVYMARPQLDFGEQLEYTTTAPQRVTLVNDDSLPLNIVGIAIGAPFSLDNAGTCPQAGGTLGPSEACTFKVRFSPTAVGLVNSALELTTDAPSSPDFVSLTGTGVAGTQLLRNGDFEQDANRDYTPDSWSVTTSNRRSDRRDCSVSKSSNCSVKLVGNGTTMTIKQSVRRSGLAGESLAFIVFTRASSVPSGAVCQVKVVLYRGSKAIASKTATFEAGTHDFQGAGGSLVAPGAFNKADFTIVYKASSGSVWFDAASLAWAE